MFDFKEIFDAWVTSFKPTDVQTQHASDRARICRGDGVINKCEHYTELIEKKKWAAYCSGCGCPIDKKIFSEKVNPCPLEKWEEIDKKYNTYIGMKHKKTIL
jgi:hypothetical protein